MVHQLKHATRVALKALSAAVDPLLGPFPGPRLLIYHQVGTSLGREMEVSVEVFARQLDWLGAHGEIVSLDSAIERRGELNADRLFVLTFDDGFDDVYQNAFPMMKKQDIPFTLYLTTKPIETGEPINPEYPSARPLTWEHVREMASTGLVTMGAHSHTHPDMRHTSAATIADELDLSNELIREHTGVAPRHFTYPWGWWSETADALVRERYATATVGSTIPVTTESDLASLGRVPVQSSDGIVWFTRRVGRGFRLENAMRRRRAGYSGP